MRGLGRSLVRGGLYGLLILGGGGRLAMVAFSLLTPFPVGFTPRGTAIVVVTGGLYGLAGGLLDRLLPLDPAHWWRRGLLLGGLLLLVIAAISIPNRQAGAALQMPILTAVLFGPLGLAFGLAMSRRG